MDRFEYQVRERGSNTALVFGNQELSYLELNLRANSIASALASAGVGPLDLVGLCLDRSSDMVASAMAIMKTGAAYVPLDPGFPADRIRYMLNDSSSRLVVSDTALSASVLADCEIPVLKVDELDDTHSSEFSQQARADQLAYVIYTSGSTGLPKGVEIEHSALANFLSSMAREPGLGSNDRLYAVTTMSFDISILELFLPLSVGACLIVADKDATTDGRKMVEELAATRATLMQATPSTWRILLDANWQGGTDFRILCGGEPFPADLADELIPRVAEVWNMFGPTETTIWSSCARLVAGEPIHIGLPIDNTFFYVLNESLSPQPVGVPGELWIGGDSVARGYLNRAELSAERFIDNPFGKGRIYRTGDQAKWTGDGRLEHMGRLDGQVKIRGYRIELGEIEYRLAQSKAVTECAVVVQEPRAGDQRLVAFYVPDAQTQTTATELRKLLKADLPAYMIPQHFIEIEALPQTPNAKIDRKALLEFTGHSDNARDFIAPATDNEIAVAALWAEMLGVEKVGAHDNFFDIGGHSLLAIRVRAGMEEKLGLSVTLQSLTSDGLSQIASQMVDKALEKEKSTGFGKLLAKLRRH
ncbi:MAG: amino acid adenylation domain-containing protein [Pseudomonadota bacterium]